MRATSSTLINIKGFLKIHPCRPGGRGTTSGREGFNGWVIIRRRMFIRLQRTTGGNVSNFKPPMKAKRQLQTTFNTRIAFVLGIIFALLWVSSLNAADVYTWTDENGVKHFSNAPPGDAEDVEVKFKEAPHDPGADNRSSEAGSSELDALIREVDADNEKAEAEAKRKAEEAKRNKAPGQEERIRAEEEKLKGKITDLEEKPLEYFGSQRNKRAQIGFYKYRLEALRADPEKYFKEPAEFEGNIKEESE